MKNLIEQIDWDKGQGLIPVIIQNSRTNTVLMLGYMNRKALQKTLKTRNIWFYSRSKKRLWMKGETSKNILKFVEVKFDCDRDTLLVKAKPNGPACHNGSFSCFDEEGKRDVFDELFKVIVSRKKNMPCNSYTSSLFRKGLKEICAKIQEESAEIITSAKKESKKRLIEEAVDLLYHLFVLLVSKDIEFPRFLSEIKRRRK